MGTYLAEGRQRNLSGSNEDRPSDTYTARVRK